MKNDHTLRLIEVSLPLARISEQSAREKSIRHGHISTLHIWWARRPLAAMRTAIFASLVPALESEEERQKLEGLIATIVDWDQVKNGSSAKIREAQELIRQTFPDRPPRLLDPFMGGGATGLEALRLGCETHAVELNPVAHLIELCTLVYPQEYGQIGESANQRVSESANRRPTQHETRDTDHVPRLLGMERTAQTPINPACRAEMPLVRGWWLAKKSSKQVTLQPVVDREKKTITFEIVESDETDLDPRRCRGRRGCYDVLQNSQWHSGHWI